MDRIARTITPVAPFDFELTAGYLTYFQGRYATDSLTDGVYRRLLDLDGRLVLASVSSAGSQQVGSASAESYHGVFGLQVVGWRTNSCFPPDNYKSQALRMRHHLGSISYSFCSRIS